MQPVYVMMLGALLTLGLGGTFDASYDALREDGVAAAAATFIASTREVIRSNDPTAAARQRDLHRDWGIAHSD